MKSADDSMSLLSSEDSEDEIERREMPSPSVPEAPSEPARIPAERKMFPPRFPSRQSDIDIAGLLNRDPKVPGKDKEPRFVFGQYNGERFSVIAEEELGYFGY